MTTRRAGLLGLALAMLASAATAKDGGQKATYTTGMPATATGFYGFSGALNAEAAMRALKPICLFVYDDSLKTSNTKTRDFAENIFYTTQANNKTAGSTDLRDALRDFTCVQAPMSSKAWPPQYLAGAKGGAWLLLMTCDGTVRFTYTSAALAKDQLVAACKAAKAANASVVEAVKKKVAASAKQKPADDPAPDAAADRKADGLDKALGGDPKADGKAKSGGAGAAKSQGSAGSKKAEEDE